MPSKVWDEITYQLPLTTAAPLKFGIGEVVAAHTL